MKKRIIISTFVMDIGFLFFYLILVFEGPNLYTYNFKSFIDACIGFSMLIAYNHFLAYIILKCVNYIKIEGNVLFLKNINGECMNYRVEDVEMIIKRKTGYKIKTRDKNFRVDYNQDVVCIIVNGEERKEIIPNDFPNAIYEVKE